jgi:hypothetical protein
MRKAIWLTLACAASVGVAAACKATDEVPGSAARPAETKNAAVARKTRPTPAAAPTAAAPHDHEAETAVRRITVAELQEALQKNEAVVVDVRNQASYDTGHIKDSILIPEGETDKHLDKLPKDKLIVAYCA